MRTNAIKFKNFTKTHIENRKGFPLLRLNPWTEIPNAASAKNGSESVIHIEVGINEDFMRVYKTLIF